MNTLIIITIVGCGILMCQAATTTTAKPHHTHGPHHTHNPNATTREPAEHEGFYFYYNPGSTKMIIHNGHSCYIVTMTSDEISQVHSDAGLRATEVRILTQLSTSIAVMKDSLDAMDVKHCGKNVNQFYAL